MKFVLASPGQAHSFDMAKEMQSRGLLERLFTCYPMKRLTARGLNSADITSIPGAWIVHTGLVRLCPSPWFKQGTEAWPKYFIDRSFAKRIPKSDVFIGLSSASLVSGREARKKGALWVCDRPCSHIETQDRIVREEHAKRGSNWPGVSRQVIDIERAEYDECDIILVASEFSKQSFIEHGFDEKKVWVIPYGTDNSQFYPVDVEREADFEVLFVGGKSLRKGIPYLVDAFEKVDIPGKRLTLLGGRHPELNEYLDSLQDRPNIREVPSVGRPELRKYMSAADVLVLPSVEDGYGLVVTQALGCGCPVVVSNQAGAADAVIPGSNGFVFRSGDSDDLAAALKKVAEADRAKMRSDALASTANIGRWSDFVDELVRKSEAALAAR